MITRHKTSPHTSELWHARTGEDALLRLGVDRARGRRLEEVADWQRRFGLNTLPEPKIRSFFSIFIHQLLSPLIYILIVAAGIAFFIGDKKDAFVILAVVLLNSVIGAIQEGRAEQSMASLRKLGRLKSRVIRDGREIEIEASELVPGDIFTVTAGDGIPTDGRILDATSVRAAEAALTGESVPVAKNPAPLAESTPLAERANMIYAGTHIVSGRAVAIATATGLHNEVGQIAHLATATVQPKTQLELRIGQFGRYIVLVAMVLFSAVVGIGLWRGIPFAEIFMIAVSQMVSLVPEGLPVALTIALAVGVQRMAKRRTVVRRLSAVEQLGSTSVICTDKTGTLTRNEMTVVAAYVAPTKRHLSVRGVGYATRGEIVDAESATALNEQQIQADLGLSRLLEAAVACNDAELTESGVIGDPTEAALLVFGEKAGVKATDVRLRVPRVTEIPFDSAAKLMATGHRTSGQPVVYMKGAPEALLPLLSPQDEATHAAAEAAATQMANSALRVLAIGCIDGGVIIPSRPAEQFRGRVSLLGLVGQVDPPREEVAASVQECIKAGITPVMVTGDHVATGTAIARVLGMFSDRHGSMEGSELERLSDDELQGRLKDVRVFARVHPAQKLRIVKAYQKAGHVVAMTGDGVNDAPALVQANVGVAMGLTGTEVAKEAAKIVITDDNFSTIVAAVAEGRLVYQNIKKLILFLFVTSVGEVIVLLSALVLGYPPPLAAVQILWVNLVTEGALTINLIMEPHEGDEMSRRPVPVAEPLLDRALLKRMPLMVGASVISVFGWFLYRTHTGVAPDIVQTETFTVLVVSQWFNALNCRSATKSALSWGLFKNPWLIGGLVIANILHFLVVFWEPLARLFHTVPIATETFFSIGIVASLVLWLEEIRKLIIRRRKLKENHA